MLQLLNEWQHMQHAGRRRGAQSTYGAQRRESTKPGSRSPRTRLGIEAGTTGALQSLRRWSIVSLPWSNQGVLCLPMMFPMRCVRG